MEEEYKGVCLELDTNSQVEYNRRKNVEQDNQLKNLSKQVQNIINQSPAGYLPRVYYGLQQGQPTYRFSKDAILDIILDGPVGQSYEFYEANELPNAREYIPAIGVKQEDGKIQIIIQGDYNSEITSFKIVNMTTGISTPIEILNKLTEQPASYLGIYSAENFKEKQVTALYDVSLLKRNIIFASIDINLDGVYNWVAIGQLVSGKDGASVYSANDNTINSIVELMKVKDSFIAGNDFTIDEINVVAGDIYELTQRLPTRVFEKRGSIKGPQGIKGNTGENGKDGKDGDTPQIIDNKWNIGGVDTGVIAVGQNGKDGQNGKSFQIVSGLWSVPANVGKPNNLAPDGSALNTLPSLPRTGITGLAAVVYDPITTPLDPRYDLYFANDNDTEWTIIEHYNGTDGKDGKDGKTPYIKDNNWYIGDTNTGVQAQGQTGEQGPQGKSIVPVDMPGDIELLKADDSFICMQDITLPTVPTTKAKKGDIYLIVTASPDLEVSFQGNLTPTAGGGVKLYRHCITMSGKTNASEKVGMTIPMIDTTPECYTKESFFQKYEHLDSSHIYAAFGVYGTIDKLNIYSVSQVEIFKEYSKPIEIIKIYFNKVFENGKITLEFGRYSQNYCYKSGLYFEDNVTEI